MKDLLIKATDETPSVRFLGDGKLKLKGRSYYYEPHFFFYSLIFWCKQQKSRRVIFQVKVEYINTSSSKCLYHLFQSLENNASINNIEVQWYYETEDEDMLELGEIYSEVCSKAMFRFYSKEELYN